MSGILLEAKTIARRYPMRRGLLSRTVDVRAVDGVSLGLARGETLGIVGESGSGKSTAGRMVLGLETPDAGEVRFGGVPMPPPGTAEWRRLRARMQMIFQDPLGALDRRLPVADQIAEPLDIHGLGTPAERQARTRELIEAVGLSVDQARRYPHELSGGQRQRVVIARALATRPDLIVCDEPVSALDVSIQAQVVNLLGDLQAELGLAMLFISHDLRVVRQVSRRVAVMYLGRIVEEGDADDLFARPLHPYTRALVSAAPLPGKSRADRIVLSGDPPNPADRPPGCAFHPRCPVAVARCRTEAPALVDLGGERRAACHHVAPSAAPMPEAA
ncbi:ABC transporter ATP-binding protein [Prosthecomicrobium sp. N25]|uniref:ABC transporter ATP-binding protein n=1 Tax=Prosthecomicrobium sp. N25 TaxID=3129254 RepID=UPI003077C07D